MAVIITSGVGFTGVIDGFIPAIVLPGGVPRVLSGLKVLIRWNTLTKLYTSEVPRRTLLSWISLVSDYRFSCVLMRSCFETVCQVACVHSHPRDDAPCRGFRSERRSLRPPRGCAAGSWWLSPWGTVHHHTRITALYKDPCTPRARPITEERPRIKWTIMHLALI